MATARRLRRLAVTLTVTALVLTLGVVLVKRLLVDPECTVRIGEHEVSFDTDKAELLSAGKDAGLSDGDALVVEKSLSGEAPHSLSCRHGGADKAASDRLNSRGLTARADVVRRDLGARFDGLRFGGYQKGGVRTGHMEGSAHYEGRAIDLFFRPVTKANKVRGWATAHYLVANAERLRIETVIYDAKIWTHRRSLQGWRDYKIDTSGKSAAVRRVLLHRDHVHVDVAD